jgi:uncharacterized membrane protein YphA (DoxX/SURF4 family)
MSQPEPTTARRLAALVAGLVLGAVFLVAALAKVLHPAALADQIVREGLGGWIPPFPLAVLVLGVEAGLGTALLVGVRSWAVLAPTSALSLAFLVLTGRTYYQALQGTLEEEAGCGCFGNLIERTPAEAFWQDLGLLAVPLLVLFWAVRPIPALGSPRRSALALLVGLGVTALAWKAPGLPVDDWATRLGPGVALGELCTGRDPRVCVDSLAPELRKGRHWVMVAELGPELEERTPALGDALAAQGDWELWLLTSAEGKELDRFRWMSGPSYHLVGEVPAPLMAGLYRTLPRSFEVRDGVVVRTASGWPPWLEGEP